MTAEESIGIAIQQLKKAQRDDVVSGELAHRITRVIEELEACEREAAQLRAAFDDAEVDR